LHQIQTKQRLADTSDSKRKSVAITSRDKIVSGKSSHNSVFPYR
jgi:hypothetical protein